MRQVLTQDPSHTLAHLILLMSLWESSIMNPISTDEETKAESS